MSIFERFVGLAIAFGCTLVVSSIGAWLTDIGPWYLSLKQPEWKPPDAAFGIIWSTIFCLCAFSGWRGDVVLTASLERFIDQRLYFNQHRPDWAMTELYFLWASVLLLIIGLWRLSKLSSLLLLPYLVWVTTAGFLNAATIELNGPFG